MQRRRDTEPEMQVRRALHRRGLRYIVNASLPGMARRRADLLFRGSRVAVFVDGCFWHSCPLHASKPKVNGSWWEEKLSGNVRRDRETDAWMKGQGWLVIRVWEHEDAENVADQVEREVRARQDRR
jgi:DNA mismatch endonuclease (patch repair protein)